MRWVSTRESAIQGEPSVFAIVETLAATGLSVWIGATFGTWWHVFAGAAIAPLMLIRTDTSCRKSIVLLDRYLLFLDRHTENAKPSEIKVALVSTLGFWATPVAAAFSRAMGALHTLLFAFDDSIRAIPKNFSRITIATDSFVSPEVIPLPDNSAVLPDDPSESLKHDKRRDALSSGVYDMLVFGHKLFKVMTSPLSMMYKFSSFKTLIWFLFVVSISLFVFPYIVMCVILALVYRLSIKSTALVWIPLLWALAPVKPADHSWETQLAIERDLKKPQLIAVWSAICLAALAVKYVLWASRFELAISAEMLRAWLDSHGWNLFPGIIECAIAFVRPGAVPRWQVATFLNSLLGVFFWIRVRRWLVEYSHKAGPADSTVDRTIKFTFFFRRLFTCYIIACNLYIVWNVAKELPVPQIGPKLFPWV